jgi:divinyl protochlorophyllide a 8-vinyl-reductase
MSKWRTRMSTGTAEIGPNAVTQLIAALAESAPMRQTASLFATAGVSDWLGAPPERMVDERPVARLHQTVRGTLAADQAVALLQRAGRLTADYLLHNRIPRPAQLLLKMLPRAWAARLLVTAIAAHAWTFVGSGQFSAGVRGRMVTIEIANNPLCAGESSTLPVCVWHEAVLQRLFSLLVSRHTQVRETDCAAQQGDVCRFEVRLG